MFDILMYFAIFIQVLPILLLLSIRNKVQIFLKRTLFLLCTINIVTDLLSIIMAPIYKNNNPIYHVYTLVIGIIILIMYKSFFKIKILKSIINFSIIFFSILSIFIFFYHDGYKYNNTVSNILLSILIVTLSFVYFYILFIDMKIKNLLIHPPFWIISAFLIFYGSTFYLSLFEDFISSYNYNLLNYTWPVQLITTIIFNLILAKGIWTMRK